MSSAWVRSITIAQAIQHRTRTIHLVKTSFHIHYPEQKADETGTFLAAQPLC